MLGKWVTAPKLSVKIFLGNIGLNANHFLANQTTGSSHQTTATRIKLRNFPLGFLIGAWNQTTILVGEWSLLSFLKSEIEATNSVSTNLLLKLNQSGNKI